MTSHPNPTEPEALAALHMQDALHLRGMLLGLADLGAELTRMVVQQAKDQVYAVAPAAPLADATVAYDRVMRSIRRTVMLVQKLTEPAPAPKAAHPAQDRVAARKQIIRKVEDALHRDAPKHAAERLHAEFLERLEAPEFDDDITQRPVADIIAEICGDLGLDALGLYRRRTPADIALLCARAAAPCRADATGPSARPMQPAGQPENGPPFGDVRR